MPKALIRSGLKEGTGGCVSRNCVSYPSFSLKKSENPKSPASFTSVKPLVKIDPADDTVVFFSIKGRDEEDALQVVQKIRSIVVDQIPRPCTEGEVVEHGHDFVAKFIESLEIKPGFCGVSIDLKRLVRR